MSVIFQNLTQLTLTLSDPGWGMISTIENFLDVHGVATKSSDFSPNLLENWILEKLLQGYHLLVFDAVLGEILIF